MQPLPVRKLLKLFTRATNSIVQSLLQQRVRLSVHQSVSLSHAGTVSV